MAAVGRNVQRPRAEEAVDSRIGVAMGLEVRQSSRRRVTIEYDQGVGVVADGVQVLTVVAQGDRERPVESVDSAGTAPGGGQVGQASAGGTAIEGDDGVFLTADIDVLAVG